MHPIDRLGVCSFVLLLIKELWIGTF